MIRTAALVVAIVVGGVAHAADRVVPLTRPPPQVQFLAPMPRIGNPRDAAERRINAAMDRLDAAGRRAAAIGRSRTSVTTSAPKPRSMGCSASSLSCNESTPFWNPDAASKSWSL